VFSSNQILIIFCYIQKVKIVSDEGEAVIYQKWRYNRNPTCAVIEPNQTINYIITTAKSLSEAQKTGQLKDFIIANKPRDRSASMSTTFSGMRRKASNMQPYEYMHKSFCGPTAYTVTSSRNNPRFTGALSTTYAKPNWPNGTKSAVEFSSAKGRIGSLANTSNLNFNNVKRSNFQLTTNKNGNYRRVLDRRNLFARSKHFVKRVNAERNSTIEDDSIILKTNSFSVKKSGDDSSTNSFREKNCVSFSVKKSEGSFLMESFRDKDNREFFETVNSSSMNNSVESASILKKYADAAVELPSPKSPDLLDPNWIPERVRTKLIELHERITHNRTLLQLGNYSKSDSNLTERKSNKKQLSLQGSKDFEVGVGDPDSK
jgi:hypothetical protein